MKRRRLLRILLVVLGIFVFTGYFAFSTLLFSPTEGSYTLRLTTLVPRNVDFYFSKLELSSDFSDFPRLHIADGMEQSDGGRALLETERWQGIAASLDIETRLAGITEAMAESPVELDLLDLFGGREISLAGRLDGVSSDGTEWVFLGRTSWLGKLAFELLPYLDLSAAGLSYEQGEDSAVLSGGQLPEPLYLLRMQDVLIAGNSAELVEAAPGLDAAAGEDSLFLSGEFTNYVRNADERSAEDWEFGGNYRVAAETFKWSRAWPDSAAEAMLERVVAHFFQLGLVEELHGVLGFERGPRLRLHGELNQSLLTEEQRDLYELRDFDSRDLLEWAAWAPSDATLFVRANLSFSDVLNQVRVGLEQADRDLMDDTVRSVWGYPDAATLIRTLDTCFTNEFGFILSPMRFVDNSEGAPLNNGDPVYTWALILKIDAVADNPREGVVWRIDEVREKVTNNQGAFGIQGADGGNGVFTNETVVGGYKFYEYHVPALSGTGHLASIALSTEWFLLTNNLKFVDTMISNKILQNNRSNLASDSQFANLRQSALDSASLAVWWNPRAGAELAREIASFGSRYEAEAAIPWTVQRPRIERELLDERFDGRTKEGLSQDETRRFDSELQVRLNTWRDGFVSQYSAQFATERTQALQIQELVQGSFTMISLDRKEMELYSRARVPLD